jgi:hypothetical protein
VTLRRCGVYRSSGGSSSVLALATQLGYTPGVVSDYQGANSPTLLGESNYPISSYAPNFPAGTIYCLGLPIQFTGNATGDGEPLGYTGTKGSGTYSVANILAGDYDSDFNHLFSYLAGINGQVFIRPGWEPNGNWYAWGTSYLTAAQYVSVFQHVSTLAHAKGLKVLWNPTCLIGSSQPSCDVQTLWPGAYNASTNTGGADGIALDIYLQNATGLTPAEAWANLQTQGPGYQGGASGVTLQGLDYFRDMAVAQGVLLCVTEFGVQATTGSPPGTGDETLAEDGAIANFQAWCAANNVLMVIFWGSTSASFALFNSSTPNSTGVIVDQFGAQATPPAQNFIACVDTMKESKDSDSLTLADIEDDVNLIATIPGVTHIAIAVPYDFASNNPNITQQWVSSIRAASAARVAGGGKPINVWLRCQFNDWEGDWGTPGTMTDVGFLTSLQALGTAFTDLLEAGDIWDFCPEPNNGNLWDAVYGDNWSSDQAALNNYNWFVTMGICTVQNMVQTAGLTVNGPLGVETRIQSQGSYFAIATAGLYASTLDTFITADIYPDAGISDPTAATNALLTQVGDIVAARPSLRLVIGEHGYNADGSTNNTEQNTVVTAELAALAQNYADVINGYNWWDGPPDIGSTDYTEIFEGTTGAWSLRPAATPLGVYFSGGEGPAPPKIRFLQTAGGPRYRLNA